MSAGLMSCVREHSPPITMENSGAASLSSDSQVEQHKRRRRFHPLRNLRRIFRRRSLAHGDMIRPIVQQHQHYYHCNDLAAHHHHYHNANDLSTISTIRSLSSQSVEDDGLLDEVSDFQTSHSVRPLNQPNLMSSNKRTIYYRKDGMSKRAIISGTTEQDNIDSDLSREIAEYQRSLSEGRLVDNNFSRDTLSHSHDSVFSESATASSLSIVLKAELADALRKRKSRSDASEEDLGLPRSPSTPPRNGSHHVVDAQNNCINNHGHHHSSLGLLSMTSSDIYDDTVDVSGKTMYTMDRHNGLNEIFPPEMSLNLSHDSAMKLSHSAAKHKMAIRPKKKGPTRLLRRPIEDSMNNSSPMLEESVESFKSSHVSNSYVNKSQSLPRGATTSKTIEKHSTTATTTTTTTKKQPKSKSSEKTIVNSKTMSRDYEFGGKHQTRTDDVRTNKKSALPSIVINKTGNFRVSETRRDDRTHSEEGFFRRFINRSGRKNKKDYREYPEVKEMNRSIEKAENPSLPIKKTTELSILNVLSKARANGPHIVKPLYHDGSMDELDSTPKSPKTKDRTSHKCSTLDSIVNDSSYQHNGITSSPISISSPVAIRQQLATSYLRFSPPESNQYDIDESNGSPLENFIRHSHYRSAEMLSTRNACDINTFRDGTSVSLPKAIWPSENHFTQNTNRNGYGWGQCQQKISKVSSEQQQNNQIKSPSKGKMVGKSKSFRLYTRNFNNEATTNLRDEFVPSLGTNMPSLPNLNTTNDSPKCNSGRDRLHSMRFSSNSNNTLNKASSPKWSPIRSSSSSRLSDHNMCFNKFEINDMNLLPTSKLYSTLNTSDEIASFNATDRKDPSPGDSNIFIGSKGQHLSTHQSIQNPNINEIEDNIDKIMKSSVVTVLKKSPTVDLYQIKTNNSNVSLTNISNAKEETADGEMRGNFAKVENPPLLRHSTTTSKLDLQMCMPNSPPKKSITDVPEFMQIQLNRVDVSRPKSCIEYSSNSMTTTLNNGPTTNIINDDDKERRFSNESIEISDKKKINSLNLAKSSELLTSSFTRAPRTMFGNQQLCRGSSASDINRTPLKNESHSSDSCLNVDSDMECDSNVIIERRKSVSDKKLKFEKQIEKIQAEVKRSSTVNADKNAMSPRQIDDDAGMVTLRSKKSASKLNDDPTPELMKVFARRSLKIKDTDEYLVHSDTERDALNQQIVDSSANSNYKSCDSNVGKGYKNRFNADSNKENASSGSGSKSVEIETNDYDSRNTKKDSKDLASVKSIGKLFNGSSNRFSSNINNTGPVSNDNYRNSTAFFENLNNNNTNNGKSSNARDQLQMQNNGIVLIIDKNTSEINDNNSTDNGINKFNNNLNNTNNNNSNKNSSIILNPPSKINANKSLNARTDDNGNATQKINGNNPKSTESEIEYKGILERKAEWEKRANQAFK